MAVTLHPSLAVHPGDWLKSEIVEPHGVSINRLAAAFHVTRQTLSNLFEGHTALSADMAIRFEKACGVKAGTSMRIQATNDGAGARWREPPPKCSFFVLVNKAMACDGPGQPRRPA